MNNANQTSNGNPNANTNSNFNGSSRNPRQPWNRTNAYLAEQPAADPGHSTQNESACWNIEPAYTFPESDAYPIYYAEPPAL